MAPASSKLSQPPNQNSSVALSAYIQSHNETPRSCRSHGGTKPVPSLRTRIGEEMDQEFITADFHTFVKSYLPFVPENRDVETCLQQMRENPGEDPLIDEIQDEETKERFIGFSQFYKPVGYGEKELFALLTHIADEIEQANVNGRKLQFKFLNCPDINLSSDIEGSTHRHDGCFVPVDFELSQSENSQSKRIHTSKIAVVGEWKQKSEGKKIRDNNLQVLSANVQILNDDPSRMHGFGITLEGHYLRLWFFCRSHSAVSERVDFVRNPRFLIIAFISFMFATHDEMGYDPTIARHDNGDFTYALGDRFFRTVRIVSEYRSNNITGRMTRVWSVREVDSTASDANNVSDRRYVLKDVWIEDKARSEKEIQTAIFHDIGEFWARTPPSEFEPLHAAHAKIVANGDYKKFFLSIETDSTGSKTKMIATRETIRGLFDKHILADPKVKGLSRNLFPGSNPSRSAANPTKTMDPVHGAQVIMERDYAQRKQYRVVFKEECVAVGNLKTLGEVFDVLKQTLIPLQLLFCAGWVHRDISSGNILAYRSTDNLAWTAKLSDLEYAKKFPPETGYRASKDPKTGTPFFMPHEILAGAYFYHDAPPEAQDILEKLDNPGGKHPLAHDTLPLMHNFQHDLESLLWMLIWSMVSRVPHIPSQKYGAKIFVNTIRLSREREEAFKDSIYNKMLLVLHPDVSPLARYVNAIRGDLFEHYQIREKERKVCHPAAYIKVHQNFQKVLDVLYRVEKSAWRDVELEVANPNICHSGGSNLSGPRKAKRMRSCDYEPTETPSTSKRVRTISRSSD